MTERIPISDNDSGYDGLWQSWYGDYLVSFQTEIKKNGEWSKKSYPTTIKFSFLKPCNGCKKQSAYSEYFASDKNDYRGIRIKLCKSCNMKFMNMNKQLYILDDCNTLIKQIFKEITNANRNRRAIKTIFMQHDFRD